MTKRHEPEPHHPGDHDHIKTMTFPPSIPKGPFSKVLGDHAVMSPDVFDMGCMVIVQGVGSLRPDSWFGVADDPLGMFQNLEFTPAISSFKDRVAYARTLLLLEALLLYDAGV